jgi:signal transduction histidine kinase/DNA-binding response OmpR family regulator
MERSQTLSNLLVPEVETDMASFNFSRIAEVLDKAMQESDLLDYAILMNSETVVFSHSERPQAEQDKLAGEAAIFALAQTETTHRDYPQLNISEMILPIHLGVGQWGVLRLGFSTQVLQQEIARSNEDIIHQTGNMILTTALIALLFLTLANVIVLPIANKLTKPLSRLTHLAQQLALGNFDLIEQLLANKATDAAAIFKAEGEIGQLANTFMEMASQIRRSQLELESHNRTLEDKVHERTQELEKAYSKLKELDQLKTNFLSTVSHELRTPLTSVLGFARIIQKKFESTLMPVLIENSDKKIERAVRQVMDNTQIIVEEGERLTALINDVLDLAKMEAGRTDWNMRPLLMNEIVERAMVATSALFENKPVKLCKEFDADLPTIEGDNDRLIQVVINLISNAVKFTDEGKVTCKIEATPDEIIVSVIDSGCGIKPEDQPLVFEKFKQVGDTLTDKPKGTGLGLPICKEIVEHHGGRIWVESEIGAGSRFLFSLPMTRTSNLAAEAFEHYQISLMKRCRYQTLMQRLQTLLAQQQEAAAAAKHILIVDDDPNIRQLLTQELSAEGYQVASAESGIAGLQLIETHQPDLVILDVCMPHLNGFAVTAQLRADPCTLNLPILLHTVAEDKKLAEILGINTYLTKPMPGHVLIEEVRKLLTAPQVLNKRILIADSLEAHREALAALLTAMHYEVQQTGSLESCPSIATHFDPHLLIVCIDQAEQLAAVSQLHNDLGTTQRFLLVLENDTFVDTPT